MSKKKKYPARSSEDLDLHGIRYECVSELVENHILTHPLPLKLITGNSNGMKKLCKEVLDRHGFKYSDGVLLNLGVIEVLS